MTICFFNYQEKEREVFKNTSQIWKRWKMSKLSIKHIWIKQKIKKSIKNESKHVWIKEFPKGSFCQVFGITRVSRRPELVGLGFIGLAGALVATTATQAGGKGRGKRQ